ncbi:MAG: 50S ribosomal protein L11 methyltransferase [Opitutaceae bacterium]|nr:50S ribosomal protein L11 methyltransferase [Opitutaceae bacterium]
MALFQVSFSFDGMQLDFLEELLYELDEGHWNLYVYHGSDSGVAAGVFSSEPEVREEWTRVKPHFEELLGPVEPRFEPLAEQNWKESYKEYFHAWTFEGLHWVPEWERETYQVPDGDAALLLDPGMAFGTGNHETTRLCIEALIEFLRKHRQNEVPMDALSCCDAGCGSGILALSAKKLGFLEVSGFDQDCTSIRISNENAGLNEMAGEVEFFEGNLESGFRDKSYDLILANILASVLLRGKSELIKALNPSGRLVLGGILSLEIEQVRAEFADELKRTGMSGTTGITSLGEWSNLIVDLD